MTFRSPVWELGGQQGYEQRGQKKKKGRERTCGRRCKSDQEGFNDALGYGLVDSGMSDDQPYPGETEHFNMPENTRGQRCNHKHVVITPTSVYFLCPHCSTLPPPGLLQQPLN